MTLEQRKQLDDLLLEELNIHNLVRSIADTDKGKLWLNYNKKTREYDVLLNEQVQPRGKLLEALVGELLK